MKSPLFRILCIFFISTSSNISLIFGQDNPDPNVKPGFQDRGYQQNTMQERYSWAATASVGPLLYYGDMRAFSYWPAISPVSERNIGFGLGVSHDFVPAFGVEADFLAGDISGQKRFHNKSITTGNNWIENNPLYMKGNISEFAMTANLNLSQLMAAPRKTPRFDVKIYTGIGAVLYNSKVYSMFSNVQENSASGAALAIPYGIKFNYHVSPQFGIGIDLGNRLTTTDDLDARDEPGSAKDEYGFYALTLSYSFGNPTMSNYTSSKKIIHKEKEFATTNNDQANEERIKKENDARVAQEQKDNEARAAQAQKDADVKAEQAKRDADAAEQQRKQAEADRLAQANAAAQTPANSGPLTESDAKFIRSFLIRYDYNKFEIKAPDLERLNKLTAIMKTHQDVKLTIKGYADSKGSEPNNVIVGQRRADAIKDYLVKNGVSNANRITTVSVGSKKPVATNKTDAGRALNRRIGLKVVE